MSYPIKLSYKTEVLPVVLLLAAWVLAFYFYAHFPPVVVSHWDFAGRPNGFSGRGSAFAIPGVLTGMYALFLLLPWLDPKSGRYQEFGWIYHFFKAAIIFVLFGVYLASGLYNMGYNISINLVVPWLIGPLLIVLGNFMGKIKQNWFIGVRTPWALSSENNWTKTNRFGGFAMALFGFAIMLSPLLPRVWGMVLFIAGAALAAVGSMVYSFILYKKEQAEKKFAAKD